MRQNPINQRQKQSNNTHYNKHRDSCIANLLFCRENNLQSFLICTAKIGFHFLNHLVSLFLNNFNLQLLWQARRDSNPQHSVLETDALPLELLTYQLGRSLAFKFYFLVNCMFIQTRRKLLELQFFCICFRILSGAIIYITTLRTLKSYFNGATFCHLQASTIQ